MRHAFKKNGLTPLSLFLGLALALTGCGNNGSTGQFSSPFLNGNGFRLVAASPQPRSEYVQTTSQLQMQFSESIDPNTITGAVTVSQMQNGQNSDVTSNFIISPATNQAVNDSIVLTPQTPMSPNATFTITVSSSMKSVSGRSLLLGAPLQFSTGAFDNIGGGVTVSGPPQVTNWSYFGLYGCLYLQASFNEDLADGPVASANVKGWGGSVPISDGEIPLTAEQYYDGNMRSWIFSFPGDLGCDPGFRASFVKVTVNVHEAYDLEGNNGSTSHTYSGGFFGL